VFEGSLRKSGNRIRVSAQLVEAETSKHVWAERYDRDLADIFAVQDEISEAVTIAVAPAVAGAELQRAMRKPAQNLDAWAAYQRGLWHLEKATKTDNAIAEKFFQQAIDLDQNFADSYCGLALARFVGGTLFQSKDLRQAQASAAPAGSRGSEVGRLPAEGSRIRTLSPPVRVSTVLAPCTRGDPEHPMQTLAHESPGSARFVLSGGPFRS
jgi:adenylate cyclase